MFEVKIVNNFENRHSLLGFEGGLKVSTPRHQTLEYLTPLTLDSRGHVNIRVNKISGCLITMNVVFISNSRDICLLL